MDPEEFRHHAHRFVDWMADYMNEVEHYPVKSHVAPGEIYRQIDEALPQRGESMTALMSDFQDVILPGMTHWQHPNFHAYFPANSSPPSVLAEMLTATLGAQCMKWDTSPAAAELEQRMVEWLRDAMGIPSDWSGAIQDSASSATLAAILSAREKKSGFAVNENGLRGAAKYRVYCSTETHSSIDKAVKIAGLGGDNLVKIPVDGDLAMQHAALGEAVGADIAAGYTPLCVVAAIGTTGTTAIDPLAEIATLCRANDIWLHVDAAYSGSALLLPEFRWMIEGIEQADSFVFNPHKWLFTNFDCSIYLVREPDVLVRTFAILPEYLKTDSDGQVNNYCDWGIPLGRRFRALKLWFVLRYYGLEGLQGMLRRHIELAAWLEEAIKRSDDFEITAPRSVNLVCFAWRPRGIEGEDHLEAMNIALLHRLNLSGEVYLSHTRVAGRYSLRLVTGQTRVEQRHVEKAWSVIRETARQVLDEHRLEQEHREQP